MKKFTILKSSTIYFLVFTKWLIISLLLGALGGAIGYLFAKLIETVTNIRTQNSWLVFLLPILGLLIPLIYNLLCVNSVNTKNIFDAVKIDKKIPILLLPAVFISSIITHLVGGSAGREGAAIQIGGSLASAFSKIFKLKEKNRHILILCGISALFSAVFCTPLTATIFAAEVVSVGYLYSSALFPCFISSITAYYTSILLGTKPEKFIITKIPDMSVKTVITVLLVGILGAIISIIFCKTMHMTSHIFEKLFKNNYIKIAVGGSILILLSLIFKSGDYNGGGMHIVEKIFIDNEIKYESFIIKILFTAITIAAGYKGGEIVPTIFIGAAFGGVFSLVTGSPMDFCAAIGVCSLFSGVTNCPISTLFLSLELFGANGILYYALATFISFLLSGYSGLFTGQKLIFSKLSDKIIEIDAN